MIETITVVAKSELKVSKNKRTYFTIGDEKGRTFVCFKPALHPELEVGTAMPIDFDEPTKQGDSYRLNGLAIYGKVEEVPKPDTRESLEDVRAERIEKAVWWKQLGDRIGDKTITANTPEGKALRVAYFAEMFRVLDIKVSKTS